MIGLYRARNAVKKVARPSTLNEGLERPGPDALQIAREEATDEQRHEQGAPQHLQVVTKA